jgi:DNA-binding transcriptional MerR regulator
MPHAVETRSPRIVVADLAPDAAEGPSVAGMSVDEFGGDGPASTWSVGDLAAATGLTVRTLHHYDEIGLATPSLRTHAGHRRYTTADVRRLHRIVALRGFGFSLTDIGRLLDDSDVQLDVREVVQRQLDQVQDRIVRAHRLRDRLAAVLELLDNAEDPSAPLLVRLMEEMIAVEHAYTPGELEELAEHRRAVMAQLTPEHLAEMSEQRAALRARLSPEELAEMHRRRLGRPRP